MCRVTSTKTGNSILFETGGESNGVFIVRNACELGWDAVYGINSTIKKREWQRLRSDGANIYEHEITRQELENLERD